MKTLTEFPGIYLKNAVKIRQELIVGGKTPEELPQSFGESLKLDGDRLNFLLNTLEIIGSKMMDLKRAIVFTLNEGEKSPPGAIQKEEKYYLVEYYPSLQKKQPDRSFSGNRPPGKQGGRQKKGRGKGDRQDRGFSPTKRSENQQLPSPDSNFGDTSGKRPRRPPSFPRTQPPQLPRPRASGAESPDPTTSVKFVVKPLAEPKNLK